MGHGSDRVLVTKLGRKPTISQILGRTDGGLPSVARSELNEDVVQNKEQRKNNEFERLEAISQ